MYINIYIIHSALASIKSVHFRSRMWYVGGLPPHTALTALGPPFITIPPRQRQYNMSPAHSMHHGNS